MYVLPGLLPWDGAGGGGTGIGIAWFLSLCHFLGALAPWCGSFVYHLFMNHARGEQLYHRLLQLDMLGIWVSQSIGEGVGSIIDVINKGHQKRHRNTNEGIEIGIESERNRNQNGTDSGIKNGTDIGIKNGNGIDVE
ncbi:Progestin and adipoQ receptor family member 4 [Eumeta japonica]|uniref:Progestin and adipoQ receptor family member 4 n=1 Tax=Eumeta variegata TaxID=151549 RepID=A0A4C1TN53_EUMVA|nr:Progestin and adipoQ receptor family member 4 [Eumeta japonica]